jgi:hypothetical protein
MATLLAEEAHGPQCWARLGREELPIPQRLAEDGVGDLIGAQPNPVYRSRTSPSLRSGIGA